jgi:hypothetical protein
MILDAIRLGFWLSIFAVFVNEGLYIGAILWMVVALWYELLT